jgi:hypothetical protein
VLANHLRPGSKANMPNTFVASTSPGHQPHRPRPYTHCSFLHSSNPAQFHNGSLLARRRHAKTPNALITLTNCSSELINIHTAFHAGAYQQVLDFDTSSFSSSNALPVRVLQARSRIALGQAQAVSSELASEKTPDLAIVKLLADLEQGKDVTSAARKLAEQHGQENLTVQIIGGIILERAGETEEALALLSKHQGSLDAYVAVSWQRHLTANGN